MYMDIKDVILPYNEYILVKKQAKCILNVHWAPSSKIILFCV